MVIIMEQIDKKEKVDGVSKADLLDELNMLKDAYPNEVMEWINFHTYCRRNNRGPDKVMWL